MKWYVYEGKYNGKVVYIGKGKNTRFTHLNSGVSSCYYANKAHFEGGLVDVSIIEYFQSSEEALLYEKQLIIEIQPEWNIVFSTGQPRSKGVKAGGSIKGMKRRTDKSKFMGVSYKTKGSGGKRGEEKHWRAKVTHNGRSIHIGYYAREIDAAIARDLYIVNNGLDEFPLNFPEKNYCEVLDEYVEWV